MKRMVIIVAIAAPWAFGVNVPQAAPADVAASRPATQPAAALPPKTVKAVKALLAKAELVVLGKVAAVHDRTAKDAGMLYDVKVDKMLKGKWWEKSLRFRSTGWVGYAKYTKGLRVLLFLRRWGDKQDELIQLRPVVYISPPQAGGLDLRPVEKYLKLIKSLQPGGNKLPTKATDRAKLLKQHVDKFSLTLSHLNPHGPNIRPVVRLTVAAMGGRVRTWRISKAQAVKLIDHLAAEGFLESSKNIFVTKAPEITGPCCVLSVGGPRRVSIEQNLGWNLKMLKRLDALRKIFDGRVGEAMDELLKALEPQRKQWQEDSAAQSPKASKLNLDATVKLLTGLVGGKWEKDACNAFPPTKRVVRGYIYAAPNKVSVAYTVYPLEIFNGKTPVLSTLRMCGNAEILGVSPACVVTVFVFSIAPADKAAPYSRAVTKALTLKPPKVTRRAMQAADVMKKNVAGFTLTLRYHGPQDKPHYRLLLTAVPIERKERPFEMIRFLDAKQAEKIIDQLAEKGFLATAANIESKKIAYPKGPVYTMTVTGHGVLYQNLGWDMKMLQQLAGLRKVLDGDPAKAMDKLLKALERERVVVQLPKSGPPVLVNRGPGTIWYASSVMEMRIRYVISERAISIPSHLKDQVDPRPSELRIIRKTKRVEAGFAHTAHWTRAKKTSQWPAQLGGRVLQVKWLPLKPGGSIEAKMPHITTEPRALNTIPAPWWTPRLRTTGPVFVTARVRRDPADGDSEIDVKSNSREAKGPGLPPLKQQSTTAPARQAQAQRDVKPRLACLAALGEIRKNFAALAVKYPKDLGHLGPDAIDVKKLLLRFSVKGLAKTTQPARRATSAGQMRTFLRPLQPSELGLFVQFNVPMPKQSMARWLYSNVGFSWWWMWPNRSFSSKAQQGLLNMLTKALEPLNELENAMVAADLARRKTGAFVLRGRPGVKLSLRLAPKRTGDGSAIIELYATNETKKVLALCPPFPQVIGDGKPWHYRASDPLPMGIRAFDGGKDPFIYIKPGQRAKVGAAVAAGLSPGRHTVRVAACHARNTWIDQRPVAYDGPPITHKVPGAWTGVLVSGELTVTVPAPAATRPRSMATPSLRDKSTIPTASGLNGVGDMVARRALTWIFHHVLPPTPSS